MRYTGCAAYTVLLPPLQKRLPFHVALFPRRPFDFLLVAQLVLLLLPLGPRVVGEEVVGVDGDDLADAAEAVGVADDLVGQANTAAVPAEQCGHDEALLAASELFEVGAFGDHELVIVDAIEEVGAAEVGDLSSLGAALDESAEAGVTALSRAR